jgi:hypothetical protein
MPASPIARDISKEDLPKDWKSLDKVIIPDNATAHYYGVWYDVYHDKPSRAWLMCCHIEDNPSINDNWYHVEEMEEEHRHICDMIQDIYGVSFHDSIWVKMTATEVVKRNPLVL